MTDDNAKQGFKVADKRRFDASGNETGSAESASSLEASNKGNSADPKPDAAKPKSRPGQEIDFSSFVMSLATQAVVQLGEMPAPAGVQIDVDVSAAKQTIDILSMLQDKTKGNLEASEASLIEEILHTLRMSYVKHA
jgi:hypothetical protein